MITLFGMIVILIITTFVLVSYNMKGDNDEN
jgi:hypothetical protein